MTIILIVTPDTLFPQIFTEVWRSQPRHHGTVEMKEAEISRRGGGGNWRGGEGQEGRREKQLSSLSHRGRREGGGDRDLDEVAAPCHCGRGLLGSLFGFIIGYTCILLLPKISLIGIFFISFFTTFGYLGSGVENPLEMNFKLFTIIFMFCFLLYEVLFHFFEEFIGLFISSLIVGNLLPYFEIFLRLHGLIVVPYQSSCCENEMELSV